MAEVGIGGTVPLDPTEVSAAHGLPVQMLEATCATGALADEGDTGAFKHTFMLASKKATYEAALKARGILVKNSTFADPNTFPFLDMARIICPWYENSAVLFTIGVDFTEAISPTNFSTSSRTDTDQWDRYVDVSDSITADPVPVPFPSSTGPWTASYEISKVDPNDCEGDVRIRCELISTTYTFLSGTPVKQTKTTSCLDFINGIGSTTFFWTGLDFSSGGPIGLVKTLSLAFTGGAGVVP